jgi:DNA-binding MarR family transcriptional regulator
MPRNGGGVVSIDAAVLRFLRSNGSRWGFLALSDALDIPKGTLSRATDRLARAGLVEKLTDPTDKRARIIYATESTAELSEREPRTARALAALSQ